MNTVYLTDGTPHLEGSLGSVFGEIICKMILFPIFPTKTFFVTISAAISEMYKQHFKTLDPQNVMLLSAFFKKSVWFLLVQFRVIG